MNAVAYLRHVFGGRDIHGVQRGVKEIPRVGASSPTPAFLWPVRTGLKVRGGLSTWSALPTRPPHSLAF